VGESAAAQLSKRVLVKTRDFEIEHVACACRSRAWSTAESSDRYAIVFLRRGCFYRRANGLETFIDPHVVYFERPSDEQEIAHPRGGDLCTCVYLSLELLASLNGCEPTLPGRPVFTDASLDLGHHELLASLIAGSDEVDIAEAVVSLVAAVLERSSPAAVASGRPATRQARRRAVDGAREALSEKPDLGLVDLARLVACSPHHLSRAFKAETGETLSHYRNRLRTALALERLAAGERSLARLAADLGFSDHAHLTRVVQSELRVPPSQLRAQLNVTEKRE
jgi:AraC-like DNA-binding protein